MNWEVGGFWQSDKGAVPYEWNETGFVYWTNQVSWLGAEDMVYINRDDGKIYSKGRDGSGELGRPPWIGFGQYHEWGETTFPAGAIAMRSGSTTYALYSDGQLWGAGQYMNSGANEDEPTAEVVSVGVRAFVDGRTFITQAGELLGMSSSTLTYSGNAYLFGKAPAPAIGIKDAAVFGSVGIVQLTDGTVLTTATDMRDAGHYTAITQAWATPPNMPSGVIKLGAAYEAVMVLTDQGELYVGSGKGNAYGFPGELALREMRLLATGVRNFWPSFEGLYWVNDADGHLWAAGRQVLARYDHADSPIDNTANGGAPADVIMLGSDEDHAVAVTASGDLWTRGHPSYNGQDLTTGDWGIPATAAGVKFINCASMGRYDWLAIAEDGEVWFCPRRTVTDGVNPPLWEQDPKAKSAGIYVNPNPTFITL